MKFDELLKLAVEATTSASTVLLEQKDMDFARSDIHFSNEVDFLLSKVIEDKLSLSGIPILDEDSLGVVDFKNFQGNRWVVDPLDGTINALSGSPDAAISVALCDSSHRTVLASVQLPYHKLHLRCSQGNGLFVNDTIFYARKSSRTTPIISFGVGAKSETNFAHTLKVLEFCLAHKIVTRQVGSSVIDIARVALGVWDAYFQEGLYLWDFAAVRLMIRESGGYFIAIPEEGQFEAGREQYTVCAIRNGAPISSELKGLMTEKYGVHK